MYPIAGIAAQRLRIITMDDLISRTEALDAIDGIKAMRGSMEQLAIKALCWAAVKTIPHTINVAPVVHGRWIDIPDKPEWIKRCAAYVVIIAAARVTIVQIVAQNGG